MNISTMTFTALDLLARVDGFYQSGWNHLVIIGSLLIFIVGIVIPLYLDKIAKKREYKIVEELKSAAANIKNELEKNVLIEVENKINEKIKEAEKKLDDKIHLNANIFDKKVLTVRGLVFHTLAYNNQRSTSPLHYHVVKSALDAICCYCYGEEELGNLRAVLTICHDSFMTLWKNSIDENLITKHDEAIKALAKINKRGEFDSDINTLKSDMTNAKMRTKAS